MKNTEKANVCFTIAKKARQWAEQNKEYYDMPYDLCGMCGIASVYLLDALNAAGITDAEIVCNQEHAFIEWQNYIIDVTATQFNKEVVEFKKRKNKEPSWWQEGLRFSTSAAFIEYQKDVGWPEEQIYDFNRFTSDCVLAPDI